MHGWQAQTYFHSRSRAPPAVLAAAATILPLKVTRATSYVLTFVCWVSDSISLKKMFDNNVTFECRIDLYLRCRCIVEAVRCREYVVFIDD